jgi:hypothetical protein
MRGFKLLPGRELTDEEKEYLRRQFSELTEEELKMALEYKPPYGIN